jgi:signal transduction histidine kinase
LKIGNRKLEIENMGGVPNSNYLQLTQLFQNLIGNAIKFHGDEPFRRKEINNRDKWGDG